MHNFFPWETALISPQISEAYSRRFGQPQASWFEIYQSSTALLNDKLKILNNNILKLVVESKNSFL
jgi:hypothetical protein